MRRRRAILLLVLVLAGCTADRAAPPAPTPAPTTTAAPGEGARVPAGFEPVSAAWIAAGRGWVLGRSTCGANACNALLRTVDGGATWTALPAPPPGPSAVRTVRFADDRNGWLYGPELWATHDGGSTWKSSEAPAGATNRLEVSAGFAYAVVGTHVFTTEAGAFGWRQAGAEEVDPYASLAGRYVVGAGGTVLAVTAAGVERRGAPCSRAGTVLATAGDDVVAVCTSGVALGSATKSMVVSTDGARAWRPAGTPPAPGSVTGVAAASASIVVLAAASGGSWLYRTEDGGRTWATVYTELTGGAAFEDLAFADATHGAVVIGGRLLRTADAGRTWSEVRFSP